MQIMAGTPQMKLFTTLLIDSIVANITSSPFLFINHVFDFVSHYRIITLNFNCSSIARFYIKVQDFFFFIKRLPEISYTYFLSFLIFFSSIFTTGMVYFFITGSLSHATTIVQ